MPTKTKVDYLEQSMAEFKGDNGKQHQEIKNDVASYHKDTSTRLDTLNTVIVESWKDMGNKIDSFKNEVMCDRASVARELSKTAKIEDLEQKADREDVASLSNRLWGLIIGLGTILGGFLIWVLQETIKRSWK